MLKESVRQQYDLTTGQKSILATKKSSGENKAAALVTDRSAALNSVSWRKYGDKFMSVTKYCQR
jgi:hypothetical protein